MTIGELIKQYRNDKGMTQKQLAEMLGLAEITIRQYETNKREPKIPMLRRIAKILGVSFQDLTVPGSITTEMNFDSDEEATLYLGIIGNLEKMNIEGYKETKHYTDYLLSNSKYIDSDEPPQE